MQYFQLNYNRFQEAVNEENLIFAITKMLIKD